VQNKAPKKRHLTLTASDSREPMPAGDSPHDRRKQDARLKMYETRLELAANAADAGFWSLDLSTYVVWANEKARDIFQFPRTVEITFEQFLDKIYPDDVPIIKDAIHKALHEGQNLNVEYRIVLPDGSIRWIQSHGALQRGTGEYSSCLMGASADVTQRKMSEQAFARQLSFETLLAEMSSTFARFSPELDVDGQIEQALSKLMDFFGCDRSGLVKIDLEKETARVTHIYDPGRIQLVSRETEFAALFPWSFRRIKEGQYTLFSDLDELPPESEIDRRSWEAMGVISCLSVPLTFEDNVRYLIVIHSTTKNIVWPQATLHRLQMVGELFTSAIFRKRALDELINSYNEIAKLKEKLEVEANYLRAKARASQSSEEIIGKSEPIIKVLAMVEQVASTSATVLVSGETGTGKELIAQEIHNKSPRRNKLMVKVNCASLPPSLIESELFGREKGAYTGAMTRQIGRFELADNSSLFLDEIAELSWELQAKLLRVLQEGEFERLGSSRTIKVNVRVIAATNRNLLEEVKKGKFREDLYYRLNVFPIVVPPLRERLTDIPMLVWAFVSEFNEKMGRKITKISKSAMASLQTYSWPGNIRELRNVIEHAVIVSSEDELNVRLPKNSSEHTLHRATLDEMEYHHIEDILRQTSWRIKGSGGAAEILGVNAATLYSRMKKLGIPSQRKKFAIDLNQ